MGSSPSPEELTAEFDAVFLAFGELTSEAAGAWNLSRGKRGLTVDRFTYQTSRAGIFAGGNAVQPSRLAVRAAAHGKEAAAAIHQHLTGLPVTGAHRPFTSRIGKLRDGEIGAFLPEGSGTARIEKAAGEGYTEAEAPLEALRCLHCDCRTPDSCRLRECAELCGAQGQRFKGERSPFVQLRQHAEVMYEPGKCIACGLCIQIAAAAREPLGLSFIGRGFSVRVGVPFDEDLSAALTTVARRCVEACPTGALAFQAD